MYDTNICFKEIKTNHASGMKIMELNQGFPFMENALVKTYSTPSVKLENILNISDFFARILMSCMYMLFLYKRKRLIHICMSALAGSVHRVG